VYSVEREDLLKWSSDDSKCSAEDARYYALIILESSTSAEYLRLFAGLFFLGWVAD
jgi:hypothetical protein